MDMDSDYTNRERLSHITDALSVPFPREALKQRSGGNKTLTYVEGHTVIHRLIDATNNGWDFKIISIESREIKVERNGQSRTDLMMLATVELTIPGLGTRQHVGVQMVAPGSGEDLVKGCVTDALKKAATLFGVGLELYGPDYEAGEIASIGNTPVARPQPPQRTQTPERAPTDLHGGITPKQAEWINDLAIKAGLVVIGPEGDQFANTQDLQALVQTINAAESWPEVSRPTASAMIDTLRAEVNSAAQVKATF